jgi:hypothetical protein
MVSNATFDNILVISWRSVLLVEKPDYLENLPTCRKSLTKVITYNRVVIDLNLHLVPQLNS